MNIETLRKLAGKEEIDYQFVVSALKGYARPSIDQRRSC